MSSIGRVVLRKSNVMGAIAEYVLTETDPVTGEDRVVDAGLVFDSDEETPVFQTFGMVRPRDLPASSATEELRGVAVAILQEIGAINQ